jgi:Ca2+-binding RTX toxin-like protein
VLLAAWLGWAAERADAAYTAQVVNSRLVLTGNGASNQLALRLAPGDPLTLQVDVGDNGSANFSFDRALFTRIVVNAGDGDDAVRIDAVNGTFTDTEATTLNGEGGNDTLSGGAAGQIITGGRGRDTVDGNQGDDALSLGGGRDTVRWDPGDGNDLIDGRDGLDTLAFNGSGAAEQIDLSATGERLRFFRNVGNVVLDVGTLERVVVEALGGADIVTLQNLGPTPLTSVAIDLEGVLGGGAGDSQMDSVVFHDSGRADVVSVGASGGTLLATGLQYSVRMLRGEAANDRLAFHGTSADRVNVNGTAAGDSLSVAPVSTLARVVSPGFSAPVDVAPGPSLALRGLGGSDAIGASGNIAALGIPLRYEGGPGNDQLDGSNAGDRMLGGPGKDTVDGNQANDTVDGGDGTDVLRWDPGDGNDAVRGGAGETDVLDFNASAAAEIVELLRNGPRLRLTRNVGNIVLDVDSVERVLLHALGGADTITVRNLKSTHVRRVTLDLEGVLGGGAGDGQPDQVIVNGTAKRDVFTISASGAMAVVSGLAAQVRIAHPEPANDDLTVNGLGGNDRFLIGSGLPALIGVDVNE